MQATDKSGVDEAIDLAGGPQALAEKTGESIQTVCNWRDRRQVAARRAALVSRLTGVDLRRLRPNDWRDYWPDLDAVNAVSESPASPATSEVSQHPAPPHPVLTFGDLRGLPPAPGPNLGRRKSDAEALERERLAAVVDTGPPIYCFGPVPRLTERRAHAQPVELERRAADRRAAAPQHEGPVGPEVV